MSWHILEYKIFRLLLFKLLPIYGNQVVTIVATVRLHDLLDHFLHTPVMKHDNQTPLLFSILNPIIVSQGRSLNSRVIRNTFLFY